MAKFIKGTIGQLQPKMVCLFLGHTVQVLDTDIKPESPNIAVRLQKGKQEPFWVLAKTESAVRIRSRLTEGANHET